MKQLLINSLIAVIATTGLILCLADADNEVTLAASKIAGAALLLGADRLYGIAHPDEKPL